MEHAYRVETIRAAEEAAMAVLGPDALMQRAAAGLAAAVVAQLKSLVGRAYAARVLVVVGPGNNGGDGLWAAVRLARRGVRVSAWRTSSTVHAAGWSAFVAAGGREADAAQAVACLAEVELVVDAVLGIGGRPGLREPVATFARACADARVPTVAVDLPSGLDADQPLAADSFQADLTVTFGGLKLCQVLQPARDRCGVLHAVDIGLDLPDPDLSCWTVADLAAHWPVPGPDTDKYGRGVVGVDVGSARYLGAALLATAGAVYAGAGMVRFLGDPVLAADVRRTLPSVVTDPGRVQARLLGCGWGDRTDGRQVVRDAIAEGLPLVIDADGLRYLPAGGCGPQVVLTPHAGELARLLGTERAAVEADPLSAVSAAVRATGATVLLKGATQYVLAPGDAHPTIAVSGPAWTAQAGSGDTLAGICATLLAAGLAPRDAALAASSVQAVVARRFPGPLPPFDIVRRLPEVVADFVSPA